MNEERKRSMHNVHAIRVYVYRHSRINTHPIYIQHIQTLNMNAICEPDTFVNNGIIIIADVHE